MFGIFVPRGRLYQHETIGKCPLLRTAATLATQIAAFTLAVRSFRGCPKCFSRPLQRNRVGISYTTDRRIESPSLREPVKRTSSTRAPALCQPAGNLTSVAGLKSIGAYAGGIGNLLPRAQALLVPRPGIAP